MSCMKRSNNGSRSWGPGLASGCPWKPKAGFPLIAMPCNDSSNNERCVGSTSSGQAFLVDRKSVVLARDSDLPAGEVENRVIRAVMAELHFYGFGACRECEQLVTEADSEYGQARLEKLLDRGNRVAARFGITRPVGKEYPVGRQFEGRFGRCLRRHDGKPAIQVGKDPQDIAFDAEIVGDNVVRRDPAAQDPRLAAEAAALAHW